MTPWGFIKSFLIKLGSIALIVLAFAALGFVLFLAIGQQLGV